VFCTVENPQQALAEVARVLRPSGKFLFAEHVRSASPRTARWQDRLNVPWSWYACGCQCNRDTICAIDAASFEVREVRHDRLRWISPVVRPLVVGAASPPATGCRRLSGSTPNHVHSRVHGDMVDREGIGALP
jgi:ubiquinone/menaquinone biosynthesis C-methylase UbiE